MVHGRDRAAVRAGDRAASAAAGLRTVPHEVLFSRRRFKQRGGGYFRAQPKPHAGACPPTCSTDRI
jgi:hypothetical protein